MEDPIVVLLVLLYGACVAYLEERFGVFQALPPNIKQLVNALVGFVVPLVTGLMTGIFGVWPDQLSTPENLTAAFLMLIAPLAVWLVTQIAHQLDRLLQGTGDRITSKPLL